MIVLYKGEPLRWIPDFHGEPVLWITSPHQKDFDLMKFVGGYPNEYCIFIGDIMVADYQYLVPDLSKQPELQFLYFTNHDKYGYSFVCSEKFGEEWKDGYYTMGNNKKLVRQYDAR